ncbi:MAG: hypothetical protein ACOYXB_05005 [Bacteroidota bacterium]
MFKLEYILIILLAAYIVYLNIQLARKNIFIESITVRLFGTSRKLKQSEILELLRNLQFVNLDHFFRKDKFLDERIQDFILQDPVETVLYVRYFSRKSEVEHTLGHGFRFVDSFHHDLENIGKDKLDLVYKHNMRKNQGEYLVIIGIARELFHRYDEVLALQKMRHFSIEHILSSPCNASGEPDDIYLLPLQFVKGYVNYNTGEVYRNPQYNPEFCPDDFEKNIDRLTGRTSS